MLIEILFDTRFVKGSDGETVFREMFVKGKRVRYLTGVHDFEAEAVYQAYIPVVERKKSLYRQKSS